MKRIVPGIIVLMLLFSGCQIAQRLVSEERQAMRQQARIEREHAKQYREAKKRHYSMQSQSTKRNMHQNRQKSDEWLRELRRPPFFVRWFQRNNNNR